MSWIEITLYFMFVLLLGMFVIIVTENYKVDLGMEEIKEDMGCDIDYGLNECQKIDQIFGSLSESFCLSQLQDKIQYCALKEGNPVWIIEK